MKKRVILVPGLGDYGVKTKLYSYIVRDWVKRFGITPYVYPVHWYDNTITFERKRTGLVAMIDALYTQNTKLSLIGFSAGASLCFNAYFKRKKKIHRIINVCGRVRKGESVRPSLEDAAKLSPAFYTSVIHCENTLNSLTSQDRKKILTLCPIWDEIVPKSTVSIQGAVNKRLLSVGHLLSGVMSVTIHRHVIVDFLINKK
jgi:hypothetical protein